MQMVSVPCFITSCKIELRFPGPCTSMFPPVSRMQAPCAVKSTCSLAATFTFVAMLATVIVSHETHT